MTGIRTHTMLAVPLELDDEPVGVLSVVRENDPVFEPEEAETALWKAALLAAVIANASRVNCAGISDEDEAG
jgi:transcriptional regulator with GAF, ATPase, and Fis domain